MNFEIPRRAFLHRAGVNPGAAALATLIAQDSASSAWDSADLNPAVRSSVLDAAGNSNRVCHYLPRVKRVIFLCMAGGPSHLETFDYKPALANLNGQPMPDSYTKGQPIAQLQGQQLKCLGPQTKFRKCGDSGQLVSDFLPWHQRMADDICVIKSMVTEQINHDPAHTFMNTGSVISGRPSMGAWVNYGLGSECENLPGFIVMTSVGGRNPQPIASRQWSAGFLPGRFQGVEFSST